MHAPGAMTNVRLSPASPGTLRLAEGFGSSLHALRAGGAHHHDIGPTSVWICRRCKKIP